MAYENVRLANRNFTVDVLDGSGFYSINHTDNKLVKKNASGTTVSENFLDTDVSEVYALVYDGVYFWSLERAGSLAAIVRKWQVGSDTLVRNIETFSFAPDGFNRFDCYTMGLEWYKDTLGNVVLSGATTVVVADGSIVRVGDEITLGPSTAVGYTGVRNTVTVTNKVGTTLTVSPAISADFSPGNGVYFTRNIFLFSDSSPAGVGVGGLYKIDAATGSILSIDTSQVYGTTRAATFFKNKLMFIRGNELIWYNQDTFRVFKSQGIDNLDSTRGSPYTTYALTGFGDLVYRLELQKVTYNSGTGLFDTESWDTYNYNTSSTISEVFFVVLKAGKTILHRAGTGISPTPTSAITVEVLDQFRTPLFNKFVQLVSTGGTVSPSSGTTDTNGRFQSTYTANSTVGQIAVTATVT